ncbi:MAG: Rnase Y domain-containing protein, partial [Lachnospiraceae bacterium]|nr:Rnase Y domain-containing protein [Lachnospiraceae bacterium]
MPTVITIAVVIVLVLAAAAISSLVSVNHYQKTTEAKLGSAEEKARQIIDDALKVAETKKREALLEAKEESLKT